MPEIRKLSWPRVALTLGMAVIVLGSALGFVALGWSASDVASIMTGESVLFLLVSGASKSFLQK